MNRDHAAQIVTSFAALADPHADPELEAVKVALMLEDVFDVHLLDAEITPCALNDPKVIADLLERTQRAH